MPIAQQICLRVWSDSLDDFAYRKEMDSEKVFEQLTDPNYPFKARVMFRCHFDLADVEQPGPRYHLQFGGNPREEELFWSPEALKLPRFAIPPMDLILACQLIAANFYWDEYNQFRETPEWLNTVRLVQKHLLEDYHRNCLNAIEREKSLLDHLWNPIDE